MEFTFDKLTDEDAQVIHNLLIETSGDLNRTADQHYGDREIRQCYQDQARKVAGIARCMWPESYDAEPGSPHWEEALAMLIAEFGDPDWEDPEFGERWRYEGTWRQRDGSYQHKFVHRCFKDGRGVHRDYPSRLPPPEPRETHVDRLRKRRGK